MDALTKHVLRRGFEEHGHQTFKFANDFAPLTVVSLVLFGGLFLVAMGIISYTYGEVVTTLAIIESPSATLYVPVTSEDPQDDVLKGDAKVDPELVMVKEKMVTSSLCRSYKHLVSVGGRAARFRGVSMALATHIATYNLAKAFAYLIPSSFLTLPVSIVLSRVALANFYLGWNHIVISEPSPKYWFQRIPSCSSWKKVARPTLILGVAEQVALFLPVYLAKVWGLDKMTPENAPKDNQLCKVLIVGVVGIAATFLVAVPARVTLTRVQASLLPEDQETIVPFDRSFGGKVVPEVVGGTGMIGLLDAWKTFDFHSRIRLIKLYAKIIVLQMAVTVAFVVLGTATFFLTAKVSDISTGTDATMDSA